MYFVVSGEVEANLANRRIRFRTGDFFGELALLEETMRAATVVAVEPSRVLTLSVDDFNHLLTKHPGLMRRIHKMAAARAGGYRPGRRDLEIRDQGGAPHAQARRTQSDADRNVES